VRGLPDGAPEVTDLTVRERLGRRDRLTGVLDLRPHGDAFDLLTGPVDGEDSVVLADHPEGATAPVAWVTPEGRPAVRRGAVYLTRNQR
jgi:hypothetical protein